MPEAHSSHRRPCRRASAPRRLVRSEPRPGRGQRHPPLPNQTTYRFTYTTAIVYEIVKLWQASGKRARHAFLGEPGAS